MLNKIKEFLSGKNYEVEHLQENKEQDNEEVLGSITYYFKRSDDITYMDIHLNDYEEETISKFARIVSGLSSIRFQLETLNMIKDCFEGDKNPDVFNQIVVQMIQYTDEETSIIEKINKEGKGDGQPWIKPSEMIK
tara:strand:+ start:638 stop:1045 length:408 start_codon:yes stop_codon:yes gene_type:complete